VLGAGNHLESLNTVIDAVSGEEVSRGLRPDYCVAVLGESSAASIPGGEFFLPVC